MKFFQIVISCLVLFSSAYASAANTIGVAKQTVIDKVFENPGAFLFHDTLLQRHVHPDTKVPYYTLYKFKDGVTVSETRSSDPLPDSEIHQWFGLGKVTGIGAFEKIKETTRIPNRAGEPFLWIVETGIKKPVKLYVHSRFPGDKMPDNIPEQVKIEGSTAIIPLGEFPLDKYDGKMVMDLTVDQNDPSGIYKNFLADDSGIIAGVSYLVGNK